MTNLSAITDFEVEDCVMLNAKKRFYRKLWNGIFWAVCLICIILINILWFKQRLEEPKNNKITSVEAEHSKIFQTGFFYGFDDVEKKPKIITFEENMPQKQKCAVLKTLKDFDYRTVFATSFGVKNCAKEIFKNANIISEMPEIKALYKLQNLLVCDVDLRQNETKEYKELLEIIEPLKLIPEIKITEIKK